MPAPDSQTGRIADGSDAEFLIAATQAHRAGLDFERQMQAIKVVVDADTRAFVSPLRQMMVELAPTWLDDADPFDFPTWSVHCRPFDWSVDDADVPIPDPLPPWEVSERRQMDFYLRPVRVVQR